MGTIATFARIDRKFAWSFLGFVLAAIFGGIALYTEFIRDSNPLLKYHIIGNTKILDVKEDVGGLAIIYNNEDIRQSHKTLSVLTLRVVNEGRSAVLKGYYDTAAPLGFSINSGEIIKGEVVAASTPYLRNTATLKIADPKTGEFSEVIIEPGEWFTVKCLILNPEDTALSVAPKGKVAAVSRLLLIDELAGETEESFWGRVVSGSPGVQLVRVPVYFLGFILAMVSVVTPIAIVSDLIGKRRRRKTIRQFKSYSDSKYDDFNAPLYEFYEKADLASLVRLRQVLTDEKEFASGLKRYSDFESKHGSDLTPQDAFVGIAMDTPPHIRERLNRPAVLFHRLVELGVVVKEGDTFRKDEPRVKAMNEFIEFAMIKES